MEPTTTQKLAAEAIGSFALVFFGIGAALMWPGSALIVPLAFGAALMVMIFSLGRISGGHFNPAVSVGLAMGGRIAWREVPSYVAGQVVGAIVAAAVLLGLKQGGPYFTTDYLGQSFFGSQGGWEWWAVLLLEVVLTAAFVFVVLAVTDTRNNATTGMAPMVIGVTMTLAYLASLKADGGSINPARSIGPALFAGADPIIQLWLFILAPCLGGALAGLAYPALYGHGADPVVGSGLPQRGPKAVSPGYDPYAQPWTPEQLAAAGWTPEQIATWQAEQGRPVTPAPQAAPQPQAGQHAQAPGQSTGTGQPSGWPDGGDPERTQIRE